ncbi:hypothetical protein [Streptomyces sp. CAU 1734]|uniref:hypothetical protein n=1 Tax=Streptomyces sp. CAU 1734 TaxID=3140360 RepID=UPI003260C5F9
MFQYRLQEIRRAELIEEARTHSLVRRVRKARREAARAGDAGRKGAGDPAERFIRAA